MKELCNKLNKKLDEEIALALLILIPAFIFMFGYGYVGEYFKAKQDLDLAIVFSWGGMLLALMWLPISITFYVFVEFIHSKLFN